MVAPISKQLYMARHLLFASLPMSCIAGGATAGVLPDADKNLRFDEAKTCQTGSGYVRHRSIPSDPARKELLVTG